MKPYADCCGLYLDAGQMPPTAEILMRSRYTAYVLMRETYLMNTWHESTRPASLALHESPPPRWIGLEIKRHQLQSPRQATVEFIARYKIGGRAHRLHEISRFVREKGCWMYVDGEVDDRAQNTQTPRDASLA